MKDTAMPVGIAPNAAHISARLSPEGGQRRTNEAP